MLKTHVEKGRVGRLLTVKGLTKFYGRFCALDDVSFEVKTGTTSLLLGPNGAGKTTAVRCVLGFLHFKGEIDLDGVDVRKSGEVARGKVGYVPQQSAYYENITVQDQAKFTALLKRCDPARIEEKLQIVNLWEARKRRVKSLSSGM